MPTHTPKIKRHKDLFGTTAQGHPVHLYLLDNGQGLSAEILSYGATITKLFTPDRQGKSKDIVNGFDTLQQYERESPYFGSVVGRYANRIAHGRFTLNATTYALALNNGPNHLHGGVQGYDKRIWTADPFMTSEGPSLKLTLTDPDTFEGYPGTVHVTLIYTLTSNNALKIQYLATTDKPTPLNLTNHSYFNLKDGGHSDILSHHLTLFASRFTPVDATLIPTGKTASVHNTPFDFTKPKAIGDRIEKAGGYDHNFILNDAHGALAQAAEVYDPHSGRVMECWTTQPGIQFYSGNFLSGVKGENGSVYHKHHGFCLETQHYPDSPNQPTFPSTILSPNATYRHITEYRFSSR